MENETYHRAEKIYKNLLKGLMPRFKGKILAVEPQSKKYWIGDDELGVALRATKEFPKRKIGVFRVGYPAVHKVRNIR